MEMQSIAFLRNERSLKEQKIKILLFSIVIDQLIDYAMEMQSIAFL